MDIFHHHHHELIDQTLLANCDHLHLVHDSQATDSDHDGAGDKTELTLGTDPFNPHDRPFFDLDDGRVVAVRHPSVLPDSNHNGIPDAVEMQFGLDPSSETSRFVLVEAHHYPEGSRDNLPQTVDVHLDKWVLP